MKVRFLLVFGLMLAATALGQCHPPTGRAAPEEPALTWVVNPSDEGGTITGNSTRHELEPGGFVRHWVTISNFRDSPLQVQVGVQDGISDATGTVVASSDGQSFVPSDWVYQEPEARITVGPRGKAVVPYNIVAPVDAPSGDRVFLFTASTVDLDGTVTPGRDDRTARIDVRVRGELVPALLLTDIEPQYDGSINPLIQGSVTIRYRLSNTGNVTVGGSILTGVETLYSQRIDSAPDTAVPIELTPGSVYEGESTIPEVWPLVRFDAQVAFFARSISGMDIDVEGPGLIDGRVVWAFPVAQAVPIAALLLVLGLLVARVRARARTRNADSALDDDTRELSD